MCIQITGHCSPAEHRRHRACSPTDDYVLRRRMFEKHRVNHRIADQRGERENGGERINEQHQNTHRGHTQRQGKGKGVSAVQPAGRQWSTFGPPHQHIDFFVHQMIDGSAGSGAKTNAQRTQQQHRPGYHVGRRQKHADYGGEHDQIDHARLAQLVEVTPADNLIGNDALLFH